MELLGNLLFNCGNLEKTCCFKLCFFDYFRHNVGILRTVTVGKRVFCNILTAYLGRRVLYCYFPHVCMGSHSGTCKSSAKFYSGYGFRNTPVFYRLGIDYFRNYITSLWCICSLFTPWNSSGTNVCIGWKSYYA